MNKKHFHILLVLLAIAAAACSSEDAPEASEAPENEAFSGLDGQEPLTLGAPTVAVTEAVGTNASSSRGYWKIDMDYLRLKYNQIGMFACNTRHAKFNKDGDAVSKVGNYIRNLHYVPSDTTDARKYWYGSPLAWWPLDIEDNLTFFCYAPYDADQTYVSDAHYHDNLNGKFVLEYNVDPLPHKQIDFCVAEPIQDLSLKDLHNKVVKEEDLKTDEDKKYADYHLPFNFHHALTWVTFYARYLGQLPYPITRCIIYEIKLEDIITRKLLTFQMNGSTTMDGGDNDFCTWTDDDDKDEITNDDFGSFTITHEYTSHLHTSLSLNQADKQSDPNEVVVEKDEDGNEVLDEKGNVVTHDYRYVELLNNGGWLFMIPQEFKRKPVKLTITFVLRTSNDDNNDDIAMSYVTREAYLPTKQAWIPGKQIRYYIDVDLTQMSQLLIEPVLIDWIDGNSYGDPEDPEDKDSTPGDSSLHIE